MRRHFDPEPPALPNPVTFIKTATIVVDTNALLEPYRYSVGTRDTALEALEAVQDRLWMPHQVGVEFFRHHEEYRSALTQAYDDALAILEKARKDVREAFGTGRKFQESRRAVGKKTDGSLNRLQTALGKLRDSDQAIIDEGDDPILYRLTELYSDRWGPRPDPLTLRKRVEDFHQWRVPNQVPPGFRDTETKTHPTRAAGDYLIWAEVLEHATRSRRDVLLVTDDSKNDWWEHVPGGRPRPRRELVEEFAEQTGHAYHQLSFREFITTTEAAYGVSVGVAAVDEIAEIEEQDAQRRTVELAAQELRVYNASLTADALDPDRQQESTRRALDAPGGLAAFARFEAQHELLRKAMEPPPALARFEAQQERIRKAMEPPPGLAALARFEAQQERIRKSMEFPRQLSGRGSRSQEGSADPDAEDGQTDEAPR